MLTELVLAAPMVEGVGSIHRPGLVAKALQVSCQVTSHHRGCLVTKKKGTEPVKDARLTQMYSFLPASWAGDAHKETDFLPIGNREEKEWTTSKPLY